MHDHDHVHGPHEHARAHASPRAPHPDDMTPGLDLLQWGIGRRLALAVGLSALVWAAVLAVIGS